ncbi:MAG: bacteriochlorophyll 4-vinyl reductase [Dinoroseobacter sp.]|nr:bacteriochlorophyll 4-vinyl reductase [Dinoroseobacter sp.]MDJ0994858.1 bacteriochlorophyll 4-vinyl reductase [Dinoroseobacter sp.]
MPLDGGSENVWAPPDTHARIGPNAVLQLLNVLEEEGGPRLAAHILASAGMFDLPPESGMIDERPVARIHQALRQDMPNRAPRLAWAAGEATANYIIANRIPAPVRWLLRALPPGPSARMLTKAIRKHAWTFMGSGEFRVVSIRPLTFEIIDNPVVRGEHAKKPICFWHTAVFETLFRRLVAPDYTARETRCCACGDAACRFELTRTAF